jgi:glycosyltransferase involved in cell wall biosynthesis
VRILHVTQPTEAGVAVVVRQLAADQVERGHDVVVACPPRGPLAGEVDQVGARHAPWSAHRAPGPASAGEARRLGRVVRAAGPDLVHLHSSKAGLAGRLALRGRIPTVFQPHAWSFFVGGMTGVAALRWERFAARWTHAFVCVSDAEREAGERAGIHGRLAVIPNAVDVDAFTHAGEDDRRAAKSGLGLPDAPLVVCVGRLSRQKGQDVLLRAWPTIRTRVPDARLVLVGDGPDDQRLRSLATAGVEFVGRRDDVPEWLAASDVVTLPSRWEGMSLSMLEAMALGRSVVATDVPGAREALSGGAGEVVPVDDERALADALVERLRDPSRVAAEGDAGRHAAVERYDLRRVGEQILALYREVLARS